ncbi:MAG TPA: nuclear transport factor 2 family protein [Candidatus Binataceae bacterium]|nr:nuclear transport factor 2 family protein [Candidatus Binataceae bacterium]
MKRVTIALCILALAVVLGGLWNWAEAKGDEVAQIKAVEEKIAADAKARNLDAIMKNYPPGNTLVVFDLAPPREYQGYDAFRKDWQNFLDMFSGPITYDLVDLNVVADHKLGYARMIQHVAGTGKDGKPIDLNVRVTDVLQKTNGRWLIIHEHASVPVDLATGKGDLLSKP